MANHRDRLPGMQANAIENFRMADHLVMRNYCAIQRGVNLENPWDRSNSRQNTFLLGQNRTRRPLGGIDARIARRIARRPVFEQRVLENCAYATAIPVHARVGWAPSPAVVCLKVR